MWYNQHLSSYCPAAIPDIFGWVLPLPIHNDGYDYDDPFQVRVKKVTDMWRILWIGLKANQWFHAVAIWSVDTGLSLYIDGCLVQRIQTPKSVNNQRLIPFNLTIGRPSNTYGRFGALTLDEFYMYEYGEMANFSVGVYWHYLLEPLWLT